MQDNNVLSHYDEHHNFTDAQIARAVAEISERTGFVAQGEIHRRTLYDADKTWRIRFAGTWMGLPAILRLENLKLETDEEAMRQAFRLQANDLVRPPKTRAFALFDPEKGYGWSLDECVDGTPLFASTEDPTAAARAFHVFYDALRLTVRTAFTQPPMNPDGSEMLADEFTRTQIAKWRALAEHRDPEVLTRHATLLERIEAVMLRRYRYRALQFMHAHLSGSDVRVVPTGEYVVFANHFWSWRQPGYDLAFAIWGQWMALPVARRTSWGIQAITKAWMSACSSMMVDDADDLDDPGSSPGATNVWLNREDVCVMLLNRCYGSLILDIPAKLGHEPPASVAALGSAVVAEAERLLDTIRIR